MNGHIFGMRAGGRRPPPGAKTRASASCVYPDSIIAPAWAEASGILDAVEPGGWRQGRTTARALRTGRRRDARTVFLESPPRGIRLCCQAK